MPIPARFLRSFLPALVAAGLVLAACSSNSDSPAPGGGEAGKRVTQVDPPDDQPIAGNGGAAGAPAVEPPPSEAGSPPVDVPSEGGAPTTSPEPEPGAAGSGGSGEPDPGPTEPSEAFLRGQALADKNVCVTCHQADFGGFTVFPNISPDMETGIGAWTDEEIKSAIVDGIDRDGKTVCSTMQRFSFSTEEMSDMIAFLRGLPAVKRAITSACPGHGS